MYKEHLSQLRQQQWFQDFARKVLEPQCPKVPEYTPGKSQPDWEYGSGLRHGYLAALHELGVKID